MKRVSIGPRGVVVGLVALCAACAPPTARAQSVLHPYGLTPPSVFAMATAGFYTGNGTGPFSLSNRVTVTGEDDFHLNIGAGTQSSAASYQVVPGNSASAQITAAFGIAQFTSSMTDNDAAGKSAAGVTDGGWVERFLISDPALNGQSGTMTWGAFLQGTLFAGDTDGLARVQFGVDHAGADINEQFQIQANSVPGNANQSVSQSYTVTTPFTYGTPFEIMVRVVSLSALSGEPPLGNGSTASVNFSNSLYWTGIQGFTAGGAPVTPAQVTAASGTNYFRSFAAASAPEPGTFVLILAGAAAGFLPLRRRCRCRRH
jgi:hypothetical protein